MVKHAQLTVNQIRGPYMQLLTNLQGNDGEIWLQALNVFLRKGHPWLNKPEKYDSFAFIGESVGKMPGLSLVAGAQVSIAWKIITNANESREQVMFFLEFFKEDSDGPLFEFDQIVDLAEIVQLIGKDDWLDIERIVRDDESPTRAFLQVAVEKIFNSPCLQAEIDEDRVMLTWYLQLPTKNRQVLTMEAETHRLQDYLKIDWSKMDQKPLLL